jgi:hypothetical protein
MSSISLNLGGIFTTLIELAILFGKILIIAILGWILGIVAERAAKRTLRSIIRFREAKQPSIEYATFETSVEFGVIEMISRLLKYAIYLATIIVISDTARITIIRDMLLIVWNYLPNIIAALLILVLGAMIAQIVGGIVKLSAKTSGLDDLFKEAGSVFLPSSLISLFFKYFIYLISITIALTQLGFQTLLLTVIVGAVALVVTLFVFSLLFFGIKDMLPDIFAGIFIRSSGFVKLGEKLEIEGFKGKVIKVGLLVTTIQNKNETLKVPNSRITRGIKISKKL